MSQGSSAAARMKARLRAGTVRGQRSGPRSHAGACRAAHRSGPPTGVKSHAALAAAACEPATCAPRPLTRTRSCRHRRFRAAGRRPPAAGERRTPPPGAACPPRSSQPARCCCTRVRRWCRRLRLRSRGFAGAALRGRRTLRRSGTAAAPPPPPPPLPPWGPANRRRAESICMPPTVVARGPERPPFAGGARTARGGKGAWNGPVRAPHQVFDNGDVQQRFAHPNGAYLSRGSPLPGRRQLLHWSLAPRPFRRLQSNALVCCGKLQRAHPIPVLNARTPAVISDCAARPAAGTARRHAVPLRNGGGLCPLQGRQGGQARENRGEGVCRARWAASTPVQRVRLHA